MGHWNETGALIALTHQVETAGGEVQEMDHVISALPSHGELYINVNGCGLVPSSPTGSRDSLSGWQVSSPPALCALANVKHAHVGLGMRLVGKNKYS